MCVDVFSAWAAVDVDMEDRVEVSLKGQAAISCTYTLQEPALMIVWFTVRNRHIHVHIYSNLFYNHISPQNQKIILI